MTLVHLAFQDSLKKYFQDVKNKIGQKMKLTFLAYRDILDDRVSNALDELGIDYYTEWEEVKGKGHKTDAHLGNRPFPGYNNVRMIAFNDEDLLEKLIFKINDLNSIVEKDDDKIRLFQVPLERIV